MSHLIQLHKAIAAATKTLQSLADLDAQIGKAADLIDQCLRAGNKLLVCGNGGSAADASHFATELVVRFANDRTALPAICLASDSGILTAAANDYGFDEIFARQVAASAGRCAHLPDYFRKIEEFDSRTGGSESPRAENDRASRARWRIDDRHC
jgi:phosphoheptose isomerase